MKFLLPQHCIKVTCSASATYHRQLTINDQSILLHVLVRLQDDAHIFCLPNQIEIEILGVLDMVETVLSQFGFKDFEVRHWTVAEALKRKCNRQLGASASACDALWLVRRVVV